jgi:AraC-like DNA-binding protein
MGRISAAGGNRVEKLQRVGSRPSATTIGGYVLPIAKALEYSGVDSVRILRAADVSAHLTNDPLVRLPVETMRKLYQLCVEVTNNPYFGLGVARFVQPSNLHALGHALAASHTLREFCVRLERYFRLVSEAAVVRLDERDGEVAVHFEHLADLCGETEDAFLAFLIMSMRQLSGATFAPLRVGFRHSMPLPGDEPYTTLFGAPVTFDGEGSLLVFAKADLVQPLAGSCPELAQVNDGIANKYMARLDKDDIVSRVRQAIVENLPNGECTREIVASLLSMSPTTLQSKLAKRETSFHDLLDTTRMELARSYAQQSALSVTEMAFLLGFSDTSNFARAFKRWTGVSPTDFRAAAAA